VTYEHPKKSLLKERLPGKWWMGAIIMTWRGIGTGEIRKMNILSVL
jgi:hypothetical protein